MGKKRDIMTISWKMNKIQQRNMLIAVFVTAFVVMALFNLFWEPMIFLLYASWVILNKGQKLTRNEIIGMIAVKTFMFYSCIARVYGRGPGLFLVVPIVFISILVYYYLCRNKKTVFKWRFG